MRATVALALAFAIACGSTEPRDGISGAYALQTVNGKPLPYGYSTGSYTFSLHSASMTVEEDGTWVEVDNTSLQGAVVWEIPSTREFNGTWTRSGSTFTFMNSSGEPLYTGTVQDRILTLTTGGASAYLTSTYVFRR